MRKALFLLEKQTVEDLDQSNEKKIPIGLKQLDYRNRKNGLRLLFIAR